MCSSDLCYPCVCPVNPIVSFMWRDCREWTLMQLLHQESAAQFLTRPVHRRWFLFDSFKIKCEFETSGTPAWVQMMLAIWAVSTYPYLLVCAQSRLALPVYLTHCWENAHPKLWEKEIEEPSFHEFTDLSDQQCEHEFISDNISSVELYYD